MKKWYSIFMILIIAGCSKENSNEVIPEQESVTELTNFGFLEKLSRADNEIKIENAIINNINKSTYWGYIFNPSTNIQITAIGGQFSKPDTYKIRIIELQNEYGSIGRVDTLFTQEIDISGQKGFQFVDLSNQVPLEKNKRYLILYFDDTKASLMEMLLPQSYATGEYVHPQTVDKIRIESMYSASTALLNGEESLNEQSITKSAAALLKGIIDFKYVLEK